MLALCQVTKCQQNCIVTKTKTTNEHMKGEILIICISKLLKIQDNLGYYLINVLIFRFWGFKHESVYNRGSKPT